MIAVAIDESPDDVRPWAEGVTMPLLIDPQHVLTEVYAISNVPAVVWIDEDDRIVRPNSVAFSTDMFAEFTGAPSGPHLDALRAWVRDGTASISPDDSADSVHGNLRFTIASMGQSTGTAHNARCLPGREG